MAGFGAFGKMPAMGDFLRLEAATEMVTPWDGWLQRMLSAARDALLAQFEACYMSAPIWRFALAPGAAGPQGAVGVMMPSVDRVGRQFPLTLFAQTGAQDQPPLRSLCWQAETLDALESLALDCLDDDMTRATLQARLAAISLRPPGKPSTIRTQGTSLILTNAAPETLCADLALDLAGGQLNRACAWSASIDGTARMMLTSGLPELGVAPMLFDIADPAFRHPLAVGAGA